MALPTFRVAPLLVCRSETLIVALRDLPVPFVTRPESVKLCPGAALAGGELIEFSLAGASAVAAPAIAGAKSARPTGRTPTSVRAGDRALLPVCGRCRDARL